MTRRRIAGGALGLAALALLTGCPGTYGMWVRVSTLSRDGAIAGQVFEISDHGSNYGEPVSPVLAPVSGAQVTCDGCENTHVEPDGKFGLSGGTHWARPGGIVVHVRAPGYKPLDIQIPEMPMASQAGAPSMVVILERTGG